MFLFCFFNWNYFFRHFIFSLSDYLFKFFAVFLVVLWFV
ncbi:Hypothetical Protein SLY_0818 [Strawberry lethal yellows phytoplasma (CPA) str. NZSb11]|uniref:Uncharacterized protein n=1 Tax=Strawberry lethal yellows phytoplasma (CPA) str. NZSb11 TaxID=980422 RepID=R4S1R3_PHYAS|nr:Hypothetical Protein SLY_0818 [Strawberry lethal yellows phytoplasma (CPA) str. NZSb11]